MFIARESTRISRPNWQPHSSSNNDQITQGITSVESAMVNVLVPLLSQMSNSGKNVNVALTETQPTSLEWYKPRK